MRIRTGTRQWSRRGRCHVRCAQQPLGGGGCGGGAAGQHESTVELFRLHGHLDDNEQKAQAAQIQFWNRCATRRLHCEGALALAFESLHARAAAYSGRCSAHQLGHQLRCWKTWRGTRYVATDGRELPPHSALVLCCRSRRYAGWCAQLSAACKSGSSRVRTTARVTALGRSRSRQSARGALGRCSAPRCAGLSRVMTST